MAEMTVNNPPSSTVQQNGSTNTGSSYSMLALNPFQRIQVERFRLKFLLNCRGLKRPPPSLRCTGFKALSEEQRITLISRVETTVLEEAIKNKKKSIKVLENSLHENKKEKYCSLSKTQLKKWRKHFSRKIDFYKQKEANDWKLWPKKLLSESRKEKTKRSRTHRNIKRKEKKMREKADQMIADGDVRILVDLEVPPEAIVVLGKGLGYVPTPNLDPIEARLDARRVTNKITYLANRSTAEEELNDEDESEKQLENTDDTEPEDQFLLPKKYLYSKLFPGAPQKY